MYTIIQLDKTTGRTSGYFSVDHPRTVLGAAETSDGLFQEDEYGGMVRGGEGKEERLAALYCYLRELVRYQMGLGETMVRKRVLEIYNCLELVLSLEQHRWGRLYFGIWSDFMEDDIDQYQALYAFESSFEPAWRVDQAFKKRLILMLLLVPHQRGHVGLSPDVGRMLLSFL